MTIVGTSPIGGLQFRAGASRQLDVCLQRADGLLGFLWPAQAGVPWDTALLQVSVRADKRPAPFVHFSAASIGDDQYFDSNDAGCRWLNLSSLRGHVESGVPIRLHEHGLSIKEGDTALRLFDNRLDLSGRILVVASHPDDAEIAAFALYAHRDATILTITAGNAGPPTYGALFGDEETQYRFKGRLRVIDSVTVPWIGGIRPDRCFNLGYFDTRLGDMYDRPTEAIAERHASNTDIGVYRQKNLGSLLPSHARPCTWRNLVDDIEAILRTVRPDLVVAPHPQLDQHPDHQFTAIALAEAMARWREPVRVLLYTNHADRNRYPYGPAGTVLSVPPVSSEPISIESVYSHPVTLDEQCEKLFAIESMHDVRLSPVVQYYVAFGGGRTRLPEGLGPAPIEVAYLRRGPRSNELFYVDDSVTFGERVAAFLATKSAQRPPATPETAGPTLPSSSAS